MQQFRKMAVETERKFLVSGDFRQDAHASVRTVQGYLCSDEVRTVRVRIMGDRGFITVKGRTGDNGLSRFEWEKEISAEDAAELLQLSMDGIIDKTRHLVRVGDHVYEVDEFHGENDGLVVAEIELRDENEVFERPGWLGEEVTGDPRYYNSSLSVNPYRNWKDGE